MTNYLFPTFQGWSWDKTKIPFWKTNIYEAESGIETRIQKWSNSRYKIQLVYSFLTDNNVLGNSLDKADLERLQGFFNSVGGNAEDFLFRDDVENQVENQTFAVADGSAKEFQLVRSLSNWVEPVRGIIEPPQVFINDELTADYQYTPDGRIIFDTPPPAGAMLKWSGNYYFRVRFENDELELIRTWEGLWEGIEINLITVK
jgi:uncharacterized protein (TIGR02217 family)